MSDDLKINQWLIDHFGKSIDNRPMFRVVWTGNLTEKRHGTFDEFYNDVIFLRRTTGIKEVPKYSFAQNRWALEKLVYIGDNPELLEKTGYEPIFVFQTNKGEFLPLEHRAVAFYMHFYVHNRGKMPTPSDLEEEDRKKFEKEVDYFKDYVKDKMSSPLMMKDLVE